MCDYIILHDGIMVVCKTCRYDMCLCNCEKETKLNNLSNKTIKPIKTNVLNTNENKIKYDICHC